MTEPNGLDLTPTVRAVRALFAAAACSCALVDDEGATLRFAASDGEGAEQIVGVEIPVGRGIAGWAAMSGQPIAVHDVQADPRFARDVAESTHYVPSSILAAPMFDADGEVMGVLSVLDPGVDAAADWSLAVLGTLASQLASIVTLGRSATPGDTGLEDLGRRVLAAVEEYRR
jgi:signal transduction protein with GAF and PtsI domain